MAISINTDVKKLWEAAQTDNEHVSFLESLTQERPPRAFIICPDKMTPTNFITWDRRKIYRTIDLGDRNVEKLKNEIRKFLKKGEQ